MNTAGKAWFVIRTCLLVYVCFWVGYLAAVVGPKMQADHAASRRHRASRFASYYISGTAGHPSSFFRGSYHGNSSDNLLADDVSGAFRRSISLRTSDDNVIRTVNDVEADRARFRYVLIPLTSVNRMPYHKKRFEVCMESILDKTSTPPHFFFVVDGESRAYLEAAMSTFVRRFGSRVEIRYNFLDQKAVAEKLAPAVSVVQRIVSGNTRGYYNQSIFFLSVGIHKDILPPFVHQIVMLDTDLKFLSDIAGLFAHFELFADDNVIGIAYDQQPTYREAFSSYRADHPKTRVGSPPPKGFPGFNSGVVLLDIDRMKNSQLYNYFLNPVFAGVTASKYDFRGNLGDQDFYSLIGNEKKNLFYVLPCSWNRHLCRKLEDKYPAKIFDAYFKCNQEIHVYHGSCNSTIPV